MRSRSLLLAALASLALVVACDDSADVRPAQLATAKETVLVHDSRSGNDLLMLCMIGVICNNGPVIHTYTPMAPAPATIVHVYSPASPTFYRTTPAYRTRLSQTYERTSTGGYVYRTPPAASAPTRSYSAPSYSRPSTSSASRSYSAPSYSRPSYSAPRSYSSPSYSRPSGRR